MEKCAIITGAASGMGRLYAKQLAEKGYVVIAVDKNDDALQRVTDEIPNSISCTVDLCADNAVEKVNECVVKSNCQPEILINNAGMLLTSGICRTDSEKLKNIITLHCITPLLLCRRIVPMMQNGYILNISSICAWMPWPAIGMYGNTKRFIKDYSHSLNIELNSGVQVIPDDKSRTSADGGIISVTTVCFGAVDTTLFKFPPRLKSLLLHTGFMISPDKAVRTALKAMFKRKKKITPGFMTKLSIPLLKLVPDCLLCKIYRKYGLCIEP